MSSRTRVKTILVVGPLLGAIALGIAFTQWVPTLSLAPEEFPRADVIVSLGGNLSRFNAGLDLLLADRADTLLLAGTDRGDIADIFPTRELSETTKRQIVIETASSSTFENAVESLALLKDGQVNSIVLLTSNYHMRRAEYAFVQVWPKDVRIYLYPVPDEAAQPGTWWKHWLGWRTVTREFVKWLWYRLRF